MSETAAPITMRDAVQQLLGIVERLRETYKRRNKKFTLDGRLVGDIGEVLAEEVYDISLFDTLERHHDGVSVDGRRVQIKATMGKSLTFPADHTPDYYIGIRINHDASFEEVFNGPGDIAGKAVAGRGPTKTNLHSITLSALKKLNALVPPEARIPKRALNGELAATYPLQSVP
jgi:hypothetical protein